MKLKAAIKKASFGLLYAVIVIGVVLGVWSIAAAAIGTKFVLPSVADTFSELAFILRSESFWTGLGGTLLRSAIGYAISLALFFVLYWFSVSYDRFRRIIDPIISALRSLPAVAVTLILTLVVGAYGTPIVLGVLVIMPIMYASARARTATVPNELREVCRLCGANRFHRFKALWLPCLAGGLPDSLSSAFSYNIKAVIGAEILAQTADSLGMLMKLAQTYLETSMLIAYVVAAVVFAVAAELILRAALYIALSKYAD